MFLFEECSVFSILDQPPLEETFGGTRSVQVVRSPEVLCIDLDQSKSELLDVWQHFANELSQTHKISFSNGQ